MITAKNQWHRKGAQQNHHLPAPLVVSFTSYPRRFPFVAATAMSLLSQSIRPDRVILWIARNDLDKLQADVSFLQNHGLEIIGCDDLLSYKKLIPVLTEAPASFIVTADDDYYYEATWLASFVDSYRNSSEILCRRAKYALIGYDGRLLPYSHWPQLTAEMSSPYLVPIGVEGIFYPPAALPAEVSDVNAIRRLCPTADDIWFFWMGSRNGARYRKIGSAPNYFSWPGSQKTTLSASNLETGNDCQIGALTEAYGLPFTLSGPLAI